MSWSRCLAFIFLLWYPQLPYSFVLTTTTCRRRLPTVVSANIYDNWRSDAVVPTRELSEENVQELLDVLIESDYGKQMFGVHESC